MVTNDALHQTALEKQCYGSHWCTLSTERTQEGTAGCKCLVLYKPQRRVTGHLCDSELPSVFKQRAAMDFQPELVFLMTEHYYLFLVAKIAGQVHHVSFL